jgi:hypothetical protein
MSVDIDDDVLLIDDDGDDLCDKQNHRLEQEQLTA